MTPQIIDEAFVRRFVMPGNLAGSFQFFSAVFILNHSQPKNGSVCMFWVGFTLKHSINH
jgi:hypothetical protein